jgi:hypothetical protein
MIGRGTASGDEGHLKGDRVYHYRDPEMTGTLDSVEENQLSVMVRWDDYGPEDKPDFQWSNKVVKIP